jgi:hypothetical protein
VNAAEFNEAAFTCALQAATAASLEPVEFCTQLGE